MRTLALLAALTTGALAAGCGPDFDPASLLIGKLRIIDIHAEPPEIGQGESTTLTPLIWTPPNADGGAVSYAWAICHRSAVPGAGRTINPDCTDNETADYLEPIGDQPSVKVTMPMLGSPLDLGIPDSTGGFYLPVRLILTQGSERILSFYRVRLAFAGKRNTNPGLAAVLRVEDVNDGGTPLADGGAATLIPTDEPTPIEAPAGGQLRLRATVTDGSLEQYTEIVGDIRDMNFMTSTEQIRILWYTTGGEFQQEATGERLPMDGEVIEDRLKDNVLQLGKKHPPNPGDLLDLYVVLHDGRGGSTSGHRQILIK